jgi:hypothetical protein
MIAVVGERGYEAASVALVIRHARVSRRMFYELFDSWRTVLRACSTGPLAYERPDLRGVRARGQLGGVRAAGASARPGGPGGITNPGFVAVGDTLENYVPATTGPVWLRNNDNTNSYSDVGHQIVKLIGTSG